MPQRWQTGPGGRWIWSCIILTLPPSGSVISDHLFYLRESLSCKIVYNNLYNKGFWQRSNEIMQQSTKYNASHIGKKRRNTSWWLRLKKNFTFCSDYILGHKVWEHQTRNQENGIPAPILSLLRNKLNLFLWTSAALSTDGLLISISGLWVSMK